MANKRMFSKEVVGSDHFLDLPVSCRELYFQLGMYADDDGFVAPKKVVRMVGASDDDIKVLAAKGFVIYYESGVMVIRHWKENNYIRKDTYVPTLHKEEFRLALDDEVYSRPRPVHEDVTQNRIDKSRVDKNIEKKPFFNGQQMIKDYGKWYVLEKGGKILFTGKESEIIYK